MSNSNMITIAGLTTKQKILMDTMWSMQELANVTAFIKSLPKRDAQDCMSLVEIAVQETYEQDGYLKEYKDAALACIARARG